MRTAGQSTQFDEVPERPEATGEVAQEHAHVGSDRTLNVETPHRIDVGRGEREDRDVDLTSGALYFDSPTRELVETLTVDLDGRHHRRRLRLRTEHRVRRGVDALGRQGRYRPFVDHDSVDVERIGRDAELHGADVALGLGLGETQQARRGSDGEHQEPGGHWIEGARVADLLLVEDPTYASDDVVTRESLRLVDEQEAVTGRHDSGDG